MGPALVERSPRAQPLALRDILPTAPLGDEPELEGIPLLGSRNSSLRRGNDGNWWGGPVSRAAPAAPYRYQPAAVIPIKTCTLHPSPSESGRLVLHLERPCVDRARGHWRCCQIRKEKARRETPHWQSCPPSSGQRRQRRQAEPVSLARLTLSSSICLFGKGLHCCSGLGRMLTRPLRHLSTPFPRFFLSFSQPRLLGVAESR